MRAASRELETLFAAGTLGGLADDSLMERFAAHGEEPVFEELVRRHGPMVWGVCRRILRDHHDAEDAFQATFLLLARKGPSIARPALMARWLHGVAYQTARKARANRIRRRLRESPASEFPEPEARPESRTDELAEWLDRELSALPDRYRVPIVLCELEGKTHREAAEQLGWPIGTVSGRLSRGRAMLARRLTRRGVSSPDSSMAVALAGGATVHPPAALIGPTARLAVLVATGGIMKAGAVPVAVLALLRGVLKAMWLGKLKSVGLAVVAMVAVGSGVAWVAPKGTAAGQDAKQEVPPRDLALKDQEAMQGVWQVVNIEQVSHQPTQDERDYWASGAMTITIRGNRLTFDADKSFQDFILDASRNPKRITMVVADGPNKGRHVPAIYRLTGDDLVIAQGRLGEFLSPIAFSIEPRRPGTFPTVWHLRRKPPLSEKFRVSVYKVIDDPGAVVARVDVEGVPGAMVKATSERPGQGGVQVRLPDDSAPAQLTILADRIRWQGSSDVLKFQMTLKAGAASSTTSSTGPVSGGKPSEGVLKLDLRPGFYPYDEPIPLLTCRGITYRFVVKKP